MDINDRQMLYILEHMVENPYMGVIYIDTDCTILLVNQTFADILKVNRNSLIGRHIKEVIPQSRLPHTINTGETNLCELCTVNNTELVSMRIPIYNNGEIVGAMAKTLFLDLSVAKVLTKYMLSNDDAPVKDVQKHNSKYTLDDIIGKSQEINLAKTISSQVANNISNVLIIGESGTGKELFAHAIHNAGYRQKSPFIRINCAGIPENLLESELFGYEEGAFTGARKGGKKGKFELADGGTIFFDEIGEMPLTMQAKLLSFLQEREFERVGGNETITSDVRLIAATNINLEKAVLHGTFREDLFYRLNVVSLMLPPLRNRMEDITLLTSYFINKLNIKLHTAIKGINKRSLNLLLSYNWPGNIRELENLIERAINLASMHNHIILTESHFPTLTNTANIDSAVTLNEAVENLEYQMILKTLRNNNYNKTITAKTLDIHPSVLYRKLKKYSIS